MIKNNNSFTFFFNIAFFFINRFNSPLKLSRVHLDLDIVQFVDVAQHADVLSLETTEGADAPDQAVLLLFLGCPDLLVQERSLFTCCELIFCIAIIES